MLNSTSQHIKMKKVAFFDAKHLVEMNITILRIPVTGSIYKLWCLKKAWISRFEPVHEISNNVVCAISKASDQPAHTRSLIRAFACRSNIP